MFVPSRGRGADIHRITGEEPMQKKLSLNLEELGVDSFETSKPTVPTQSVEEVLTCLQTNCGKFLCCA